MVSPRWRKVFRDLWANKTRTLLVVLSISVGVFALGAVVGTSAVLPREMTAAYMAVNPASAIFYVSPFGDELVHTVRAMPQVAAAEGRRTITVRVLVGNGQWKTLPLTAIPDYNDITLNMVRPVQGAWPPPKNQVLIERSGLELIGAKVGEPLTIEIPGGKKRRLLVAGTTHEVNHQPPIASGQAWGHITFGTLEWLGYPRTYDQLDITVTGAEMDIGHVRRAADQVKAKIEKGGYTVQFTWLPTPGEHPANEIIKPLLLILSVMGILSLLLSAFLVINTISALLAQQIRQIGIMKAIGASLGQIMVMYFATVGMFGVISLVIAVPAGAWGAKALTEFVAGLINFDLTDARIPPLVIFLQVIVGLMVPVLAALVPIWRGATITAREAMSDAGVSQTAARQGLLDRLIERIRGLSRPVLLSIRNTFRRKGRLAMTLFTLTLGGAMFISVFSVRDGLHLTLDEVFAYNRLDIWASFKRRYPRDYLREQALTVPGVVQAESWASGAARRQRPDGTESPHLFIDAPPIPTQLLEPALLSGRWLLPGDENAVVVNNDVLRTEDDLQVGDELILKINGKDSTWRIVGVMQGALVGPRVYINYDYFARLQGYPGRADSLRIVTADHDADGQQRMATAVVDHFDRLGKNITSTGILSDQRNTVAGQFNLLIIFLLIMAFLMALVGGLGLAGTMSINVLERTREIGVMRAVGAANRAVLQVFVVEGIFIGLISWALAGIVALPMSKLFSDAVGNAFLQEPLSYQYSLGGLGLWLIIVVIISAGASLAPAGHAARLSVRETLAYE